MMAFLNNITTIFVQIIIFHFKMPKSSIEDRVFSWVMHLSDLNNIIYLYHMSVIVPNIPEKGHALFCLILLQGAYFNGNCNF